MSSPVKSVAVEEFHGLYGPYQASELVLQRIWMSAAFDARGLTDQWGRSIEVVFPGAWNRREGPDFKGAVLAIDGERVEGDLEIHFRTSDWQAHGHHSDPRYDGVVLHVVYFPLETGASPARASSGEAIPAVSLMERLWYDLEEYASEDSIVASAGTESRAALDGLLELDLEKRRGRLFEWARERWETKRRFARLRIEKLGWAGACHQSALEALGYRLNRIPMLMVAARYSLERCYEGGLSLDEVWRAAEGVWRVGGARPANHPRLRLQQYLRWARARPCWPDLLPEFLPELIVGETLNFTWDRATVVRRAGGLHRLRQRIARLALDEQVSGGKLDTLFCDVFLPMLSVRRDADLFPAWFSWFAGNAPDQAAEGLKRLGVLQPRRSPMCNGWVQGMLRAGAAFPGGSPGSFL